MAGWTVDGDWRFSVLHMLVSLIDCVYSSFSLQTIIKEQRGHSPAEQQDERD